MAKRFKFLEFFAGGGMARLGLCRRWDCAFANDNSEKKAASYTVNFPPALDLRVADIKSIKSSEVPDAEMAWASFPCVDLSLAGVGAGLSGERSGTFWSFWEIVRGLNREGRAPRLVVLENVVGAITSHGGRDLDAVLTALIAQNYLIGPLVIDAAAFVPQSRPRLFVIGIQSDSVVPSILTASGPIRAWHPASLRHAFVRLEPGLREKWLWWHLALPDIAVSPAANLIEDEPSDVDWWSPEEIERLLLQMSPANREKLREAQRTGRREVGFVYRRTRLDIHGERKQRAEVRFDGLSGCLRTPLGGSSRQIVLIIRGNNVKARLLSPREAARLMGLPDTYKLPENYNEAYHLAGDGVVVPVVEWLEKNLLTPLVEAQEHLAAVA